MVKEWNLYLFIYLIIIYAPGYFILPDILFILSFNEIWNKSVMLFSSVWTQDDNAIFFRTLHKNTVGRKICYEGGGLLVADFIYL